MDYLQTKADVRLLHKRKHGTFYAEFEKCFKGSCEQKDRSCCCTVPQECKIGGSFAFSILPHTRFGSYNFVPLGSQLRCDLQYCSANVFDAFS